MRTLTISRRVQYEKPNDLLEEMAGRKKKLEMEFIDEKKKDYGETWSTGFDLYFMMRSLSTDA